MERKCIMCGHYEPENLVIMDTAICRCCEDKMITPDLSDREYDAFVNKLSAAVQS